MKTASLSRLALLLLAVIQPLAAQTLYWDTNDIAAGASSGTTAAGTWDDTFTANWSTASDGTATTTNWTSGATAVFAAGANATGTYTVTVFDPLMVAGINFEEGDVTLSGGQFSGLATVDVAAGASGTISGSLSDSTNLAKTGSGTLTLSGDNLSYSGNLTVSAGTLILAHSDATSGSTTLGSGAALTIAHTNALESSLLTVNGGSVSFGSLTSASIGGLAGSANITLENSSNAAVALTVGNGFSDGTYSGVLSGTGSLVKTGTTTLTLSGANTFSGTTTLSDGTLIVAHTDALQNSTLSLGGGMLQFSGLLSSATLGGLAGSGFLDLGSGSFALSVGNNDADTTFSGPLSGSNTLTKIGTGTLTLSGDTSSFSGSFVVDAGTLALPNSGTFMGTTTINTGGTVVLGNTNSLQSSPVTLAGGSLDFGSLTAVTLGGLAGSSDLTLENSSHAAVALTVGNGMSDGTYSGVLSGSGSLVKTGFTTLTLSGANTFSGTTTLSDGTLTIANANALQNSTLSIGSGTVQFSGALSAATLGGLAGSGYLDLGFGTFALSVGNNDADTTFSGTLAGSNPLTKIGTGTLTLSADISSFSGSFVVDAGTLALPNSSSFTGNTTVNTGGIVALGHATALQYAIVNLAGGTLDFGALTSATLGELAGSSNLTLENSSSVAVALTVGGNDSPSTYSGVLSGSGSLAKAGDGTLTLSGANTFSGDTTIAGGTLALANAAALQNSTVTVSGPSQIAFDDTITATTLGGLTGSGDLDLSNNAHTFTTLSVGANNADTTYSGALSGDGGLNKVGTGTLTLTGSNTQASGTTVSAGILTLGAGGASGSVSGDITNNGSLVFNRSGSYVFDGVISGTGSVVNSGHVVAFSAAQTYTGSTSIKSSAYLILATGVDQGLSASTTVDIESGGFFDISNHATTIAGLTGAGAVYSYGGSNGHLTIDVATGQSQTFSGELGSDFPNFALTKSGAGTLTLSGANTYTGTTTVSAGILSIAADSGLGAAPGSATPGQLTLDGGTLATTATFTLDANRGIALGSSGGTLDTASSTTLSYAGIISGSASLTKTGAGTLALTGTNTYTGTTTVSGGTLSATDATQLGTGAITVNNGGALEFSAAPVVLARPVTIDGSGSRLAGPDNDSPDADPTDASIYLHFIASDGNGDVAVTNGGALTGTFLAFGSYSNQPMNVTLASGGTVSASRVLAFGYSSGAAISASVTGTGSSLTVGNPAAPDTASNGLILGAGNSAPVTLTVADGGTIAADSIVTGYFGFGSGSLTIDNGGTVTTSAISLNSQTGYGDELNLNSGGTLRIVGTVSDNGTIAANSTSNTVSLRGGTLQLAEHDFGSAAGFTLADSTTSTIETDTVNATLTGSLSGSGSLTKSGTGILTLNAANTYTGITTVSAGTLALGATGSIANSSSLSVGSGAVLDVSALRGGLDLASGQTLAGTGTVTGALTIASGATLAPGNSPGTLTAGDTTFAGGGTFQFQLNDATGAAGTNWDQLAVNGTLTLSATAGNPFTLDLTSLTLADAAGTAANFNLASDYSFTFLTTTGGVSGFSSDAFAIDTTHFTNPFTGSWSVSLTNSGHDLSINYTASAVPEPSTYAALAGLAALGLAGTLRLRGRLRPGPATRVA